MISKIVDLVLNRLDINNPNSNCIYIDGPGDSGKTFIIYITIYHLVKIRNKHVCTMAFINGYYRDVIASRKNNS